MVQPKNIRRDPRKPGDWCPYCKQKHVTKTGSPACRGHKTGTNRTKPCTRPPRKGAKTCDSHGSGTRLARRKASQRVELAKQERTIKELLVELEIPESVHPLDGLLEAVQRSYAMMRLLGALAGQLDASGPSPGNPAGALWGLDHNMDQAPHVLVGLYQRWVEIHARACKMALDAGVDERMMRNAELITEMFFKAITKAIEAARLSPDQTTRLRRTLAQEMRVIAGPLPGKVIEHG